VRCFLAWGFYARENKRERGILKKFRTRMSNQCAAKAFASWVAFKEERTKIKIMAFKVMGRVGNALIAAGFSKWLLNFQGEVAAEKEGERQKLVMEKFLKRIQLSCVLKCVGQWREMVRER